MSTKLNPWESPTAPASPLWACCTSSIGPLCEHGPTLYGPPHFAPAYVSQLSAGMVADFEMVSMGEVRCRVVTEVTPLLGTVYVVALDDTMSRPMHAVDTLRVAQADAVTRRRVSEMGL
jgi:hypothetical protein